MLKKMSLKIKYVLMFLAVGLIPLIAISLIAYQRAEQEITDQVFRALDMYAALTDAELEQYFAEREGDVRVIAGTRDVYQSLNILRGEAHQGVTIGEAGDTTDPMWLDRLEILDDLALTIIEEYGYAVFFVTDEQGKVVFSTAEAALGQDLSNRDYAQGALQGDSTWSDLFYSDIIHENCMVISAPVFSEGRRGAVVGSTNLLLDERGIDQIVHDGLHELGESADAYLINDTGLLLTNTLLGEYRQGAALNERIHTRAVELLSGPIRRGDIHYHADDQYLDYLGNPVLGALEVTLLGSRPVGLVVEIDVDEAFAGVYTMRNIMLLLGALFLGGIAIISFFIGKSMARPIEDLASVAEEVASGDLRVKSNSKRGDELGLLAASFNMMVDNLREIVLAVRKSAEETSTTSQELASSTEETNASIEEVAASVTEFTSTTEQLSQNSQSMAETTEEVNGLASDGQKQMDKTQAQMLDIIESAEKAGKTIKGLEKSSKEIEDIAGVISSVADQTNLLALNAAIEAARAGEHGQGFAVVADEVRKLAEETQKSVGEIKEIISRLAESTGEAVSVIDSNNEQIAVGAKTLKKTGESFTKIVEKIAAVTSVVQDVASASQELSASCEEISAATEEQSASMEEISSSAENLAAMAEELTTMIERLSI